MIRTHILRPTWHIVHAADVRWMLALTAPRVKALSAYYHRRAGIDAAAILAASRVFASALAGRKLTRAELGEALRQRRDCPRGIPWPWLISCSAPSWMA